MWFSFEIARATIVVTAILLGIGAAVWRRSRGKQGRTAVVLRRVGGMVLVSAVLFPIAAGTLWPVAATLQLVDSCFTDTFHTSLHFDGIVVLGDERSPVPNHLVGVEAAWQIWLANQRVAFTARTDADGAFRCHEDLPFTCNRVFVVTTDLAGQRVVSEWDGRSPFILQL